MAGNAPQRLLSAICDFLQSSGTSNDAGERAMLDAVYAALIACRSSDHAPRRLQAAELLAPALAQIARPELAPVRDAIAGAAPLFRWRQNPNYTAANMGADFMAGYGYVEFAGPKEALFNAPDIRVGLLLLGPRLHYPAHAHPAEEIYHPLTDGGLWRRGKEDWRTVPAGHAIHHPPMMAHETTATDSTLLALYCWRGNTVTEAQLTA
ncbi:MAG TPA: dimethylsulfonioproprionate lyase family protein [Dongiaceae bacterium]|nr:dimethylsulfonioproprionate lyase family protein [Dongiaceae bacterium]